MLYLPGVILITTQGDLKDDRVTVLVALQEALIDLS